MSFPPTRILLVFFCLMVWAAPGRAAGVAAEARELIDSMGCRGCHVVEGRGGALGPSLDDVGRRLEPEELLSQLTAPGVRNPASAMPSYDHLSGDQLKVLVDFLQNLK